MNVKSKQKGGGNVNVENYVKKNFDEVVKALNYLGFMVVRRAKNDVQGVTGCKYCQENLSFARLHNLDVLERVDTFDVVGVCLDRRSEQ